MVVALCPTCAFNEKGDASAGTRMHIASPTAVEVRGSFVSKEATRTLLDTLLLYKLKGETSV